MFFVLIHDYTLCFTGSPYCIFSYCNYISIWPYYIVIHLTDMLSDLGWESLDQCRQKARPTLTYKIKHELVAIPKAPYLGTLPKRSRRIYENSVQIQYNRIDYLKHSFFYRARVICNCLPVEVTEAPALSHSRPAWLWWQSLPPHTKSTETLHTNTTNYTIVYFFY